MNTLKNIAGKIFGNLTVIERALNIVGKNREYGAWKCLCLCGNIKVVATYHLTRGSVKSCGCLYDKFGKSLKPGVKINRLTTISYKDGKWFCLCDCGDTIEIKTNNLNSGNTKSCGCFRIGRRRPSRSAHANDLASQ